VTVEVLAIQFTPSYEVICLPPSLNATATKSPFPKLTADKIIIVGAFRLVQVMPSGEVIIQSIQLSLATATNNPLPYVTDTQE
jgi:hypothetical protein